MQACLIQWIHVSKSDCYSFFNYMQLKVFLKKSLLHGKGLAAVHSTNWSATSFQAHQFYTKVNLMIKGTRKKPFLKAFCYTTLDSSSGSSEHKVLIRCDIKPRIMLFFLHSERSRDFFFLQIKLIINFMRHIAMYITKRKCVVVYQNGTSFD